MSEDYEIKIDAEEARESFGEETFDTNIRAFVEHVYESTKKELDVAFITKDAPRLKRQIFKLKTTVRYLCIENFAMELQDLEEYTKEPANWTKIAELYPRLMKHFDLVFKAVKRFDNEITGNAPDPEDNIKDGDTTSSSKFPFSTRDSQLTGDSKFLFKQEKSKANLLDLRNLENTKDSNSFFRDSNVRQVEMTQDEFESKALLKIELFEIDISKIKISRLNKATLMKDRLKNFIDQESLELVKMFGKAIDHKNKEEFIEALKALKRIAL